MNKHNVNIAKKIQTCAIPLLPSSSVNTNPVSKVCKYAIGISEILGKIAPANNPPNHFLGTGLVNLTIIPHKPPVPNIITDERQIIPTFLISESSILDTILLNTKHGNNIVRMISDIFLVVSTVKILRFARKKPVPMIK